MARLRSMCHEDIICSLIQGIQSHNLVIADMQKPVLAVLGSPTESMSQAACARGVLPGLWITKNSPLGNDYNRVRACDIAILE